MRRILSPELDIQELLRPKPSKKLTTIWSIILRKLKSLPKRLVLNTLKVRFYNQEIRVLKSQRVRKAKQSLKSQRLLLQDLCPSQRILAPLQSVSSMFQERRTSLRSHLSKGEGPRKNLLQLSQALMLQPRKNCRQRRNNHLWKLQPLNQWSPDLPLRKEFNISNLQTWCKMICLCNLMNVYLMSHWVKWVSRDRERSNRKIKHSQRRLRNQQWMLPSLILKMS